MLSGEAVAELKRNVKRSNLGRDFARPGKGHSSRFGAFRAIATDRAKFTPQYFPGRASLVPYWGTHNSDGEGVLGRRKETFVRLRSSASPGDRALATRGLRACFFSAVGPQEPSAPVGVLTSRHKKELRNTLATAVPRSPIFFWLTGNRVLKTAFVLRDGPLAPKPLTPLGPSLVQHRGSLHLRWAPALAIAPLRHPPSPR